MFHVIFLGQLLSFFLPRGGAAGVGDWISSIGALTLVICGMADSYSKWGRLPSQLRAWILCAAAIATFESARGFFDDEDFLKTMLESLPYFAMFSLPALGFPRIPNSLAKAFTLHAIMGVVACAYVLATNRGMLTAEVVQRTETLELKPIQFTLYSLFFVFFRFTQVSLFVRIIAAIGLLEMAAFAVTTGTRQAIILLSATILIGIWVAIRSEFAKQVKAKLKQVNFTRRVLIVVGMVGILGFGGYQITKRLTGGMALLQSRMSTDREGTSIRDNSRWNEIQQLTEQFQIEDYAFGRGVRGSFVNSAAPNNDNVHIGWFRVLLKCGLGMVFLLFIGPVWCGVRSILKSRQPEVLAAAASCCYFAVKNSSGNIVLAYPIFYLSMICFGTCASFCWKGGVVQFIRARDPNPKMNQNMIADGIR